MEAGEAMVELLRSTCKHGGIKQYYIQKIEELQEDERIMSF